MNIGAQEIIIIVLIIMAILLVTRVIRIGRSTVGQDEDSRSEVLISQFDHKTRNMFDFFMRLGISLVALGVILIILGASLFNWAIQSYLWSVIVIIVGAILILIFRGKR
jgi:steroid 5-alpha reductase family enzyme